MYKIICGSMPFYGNAVKNRTMLRESNGRGYYEYKKEIQLAHERYCAEH